MRISTIFTVSAVALFPSVYHAPIANAESVGQFYEGKTVKVIVGYSPGGYYDTHARLMARYLPDYLAGHPNTIVQNMPGAGSLNATMYLYDRAPKDGTVLGVVGRGESVEGLIGKAQGRFDSRKFNWIGSTSKEVSTCVAWHTSPIQSFDQLFKQTFVVGGTGPGSDGVTQPLAMDSLLGTKIKLISGYPGGTEVLAAMERGEVQGRCGWSWGSVKGRKAQWLADKKIKVIVQLGLEKAADLPNVPFVMDYAKTREAKEVFHLMLTGEAFAWPMLAPPGVPSARVAALRGAYRKAAHDGKFLARANKMRLNIIYVSGQHIESLIRKAYQATPDIIEKAHQLMLQGGSQRSPGKTTKK